MSSFQFNKLLLDISNQLTEDQLSKMKFLVRDLVGKRELEKITSGTLLFQVLTERRQLGSEQTEFLSKLLRDIDRSDLSDKLDNFENGSAPCDDQPDPSERGRLEPAARARAAPRSVITRCVIQPRIQMLDGFDRHFPAFTRQPG